MRLDRLTVDAMARTTKGDEGHEEEGVFIGAALTQIELEAGVSRRQLSKDLGASYSHLTNLTHNIRRAEHGAGTAIGGPATRRASSSR